MPWARRLSLRPPPLPYREQYGHGPNARSIGPRLAIVSESPPIDKDRETWRREGCGLAQSGTVDARVSVGRVNRSRPHRSCSGNRVDAPHTLAAGCGYADGPWARSAWLREKRCASARRQQLASIASLNVSTCRLLRELRHARERCVGCPPWLVGFAARARSRPFSRRGKVFRVAACIVPVEDGALLQGFYGCGRAFPIWPGVFLMPGRARRLVLGRPSWPDAKEGESRCRGHSYPLRF